MQRSYSQPKTQRFDHVDNQLRDYCDKNKIHYDLSKFAVIRGTLDGAVKATKRYDKPDVVPKMTAHEVAAIKDELRKIFERHYDSCPTSLDEDIDMKPDSSPGAFFKVLYGVKKTKEILRSEFFKQMLYAFHKQPEYPTLWQTSAKQELLPGEKVINNEPRTFIIPDKRYHYHCLKLLGTQHALLKRLATQRGSWSAIGKSFQNRGYHSIMAEFEKFKIKGEGDASKWDASLLSYIFTEFIIPLRVELFEPPRQIVADGVARDATAGERTQMRTDYAKSLRDLYEDMLHAYVMLPDGEVIQFPLGMKSGFFTTSDDNTLYHLVIVLLMHLRTHLVFGKDSEWVLYADDHVFGTDSKLLADFETRKAVYADCGVTLKPAADRVATTVDGMTFLGYTAMWSKGHAAYVPVYNHEKALASLLQPDGAQDDAMRYIRMSALRMVCYFTPIRDVMRDMCTHFYDEKFADLSSPYSSLTDEQFKKLAQPITDSAIEKLWLGQEDGKRNILDFLMSGRANNNKQNAPKNGNKKPQGASRKGGRKGNNTRAKNSKGRRRSNRGGKGLGGPSMPVAASYVRQEKKSGMRGVLASEVNCQYGSDIVQVSTTGGSPSTFADIVDQYYCHPATLLTGTRLAAFANLYEKYRWKKFTLRWEPKVSVEFSGDVFAFYNPNPNQSVTKTGVSLIQDATSRKYCKLGPVSRPLTLNIPKFAMTNSPNQKYMLDIEDAEEALDTYAGQIFFGLDGAATPNTAYGYWRLDWGIEFYDPVQDVLENASVALYQMTADSGQSKPLGGTIASTLFGDPELATITTDGTQNLIRYSKPGNYNLIAFYPNPSGGAGLTSTSTATAATGYLPMGNDVAYEYAQTGKRWYYTGQTLVPNTGFNLLDSAGTHPTTAALVQITRYNTTTPMVKSAQRELELKKTKETLEDRIKSLEKLSARLDFGQIETIASTSVSSNYGNSAPVMTVTTATVDQVAPIETVAAGATVGKKSKKVKTPKFYVVDQSDSDS